MTLIRNAWYAAGWSGEIGRQLLPRTFLNEPVILFRKENGVAVALADRCPHRFVPLHRGKLKGDIVECGYHGLCFDERGDCTSNPHGNGVIPKAARVKRYALCERHGVVWIWMGHPDRLAEAEIYDFSQFGERPNYTSVYGYLHVAANYQLISDNLLDLTHGQYIHPMFHNAAGPAKLESSPHDDKTVWAKFTRRGQYPNKYFQMLGFPADQLGDHRNFMRWNPPGNLLLDVGMTPVGSPASEGLSIPTAHLLTPETETSTHYFWGMARDFRKDDHALSADLLRIGMDIFNNEDKPVIEAQQRVMKAETDIFAMQPALLPTDIASVRARRMLQSLEYREQVESSTGSAAATKLVETDFTS